MHKKRYLHPASVTVCFTESERLNARCHFDPRAAHMLSFNCPAFFIRHVVSYSWYPGPVIELGRAVYDAMYYNAYSSSQCDSIINIIYFTLVQLYHCIIKLTLSVVELYSSMHVFTAYMYMYVILILY